MTNHKEWLKERKTYIGGSDIGSIVGINKYNSSLDVFLNKTSDSICEDVNEHCYWGNRLECVVADEYAKRTGNKVVEPVGLIRHSEYPFIACNIDRFVNGGEYILECKTAGLMMSKYWGAEGTDEIPDSYKCQVAYYSAITGVPKVDIAVLIGGNDFRIYTYIKDKDFENKLIQVAVNFWNNHILTNTPPDVISTDDLLALYPKSQNIEVVADEEIVKKWSTLKKLKEQEKDASKTINDYNFEIKKFMKDAGVLVDKAGHRLVTWNSSKPRIVFDSKKFQSENADLYIKYAKEGQASRTFLIK
jgi:putative phage-type endonuclease